MPKVMLVEDDNNLREIYEARLQAEGYDIVSARDGEEALVVAKAEKPELIIADVMMPKISGFEMLDILRNTNGLKDVKVIMLTALGQSDDQQRAKKLGADRYLVKSQVTLEDIVKTAHELLRDEAAASATPATAPPAAAPVAETAPEPPVTPPATATQASSDAAITVVPAPEPPVAPTTNSTPLVNKPPTAPTVSDNAASDDKLMADAVNALMADTDSKDSKPDTTKTEPAQDTDAATPDAPAQTATDTKADEKDTAKTDNTDDKQPDNDDDTNDASNSHVAIAHKKVIKPIDTKPGKDLDELLAIEEAKEASGADDNTSSADTEKAAEVLNAAATDKAASSTAAEEASVEAKIEDFVAGATTDADAPAVKASAAATPQQTTTPTATTTPAVTSIAVSEAAARPAPPPSSAATAPAGQPDDTKAPIDPNNIAL